MFDYEVSANFPLRFHPHGPSWGVPEGSSIICRRIQQDGSQDVLALMMHKGYDLTSPQEQVIYSKGLYAIHISAEEVDRHPFSSTNPMYASSTDPANISPRALAQWSRLYAKAPDDLIAKIEAFVNFESKTCLGQPFIFGKATFRADKGEKNECSQQIDEVFKGFIVFAVPARPVLFRTPTIEAVPEESPDKTKADRVEIAPERGEGKGAPVAPLPQANQVKRSKTDAAALPREGDKVKRARREGGPRRAK